MVRLEYNSYDGYKIYMPLNIHIYSPGDTRWLNAELLKDIPLGRVAETSEIADIVKFCALDAPPSMTGAVIDANGASFVR